MDHGDYACSCDVGRVYSSPNPALKHARTEAQSNSESLPITRTFRWSSVTGNSLKKDG